MSTLTPILVIIVILFVLNILGVVIFVVDWRAFFLRRYGQNYKKGLAHIKVGENWLYRESELIYESDIAMTYIREVRKGVFIDDIVPAVIGFDYDESTGRRQYRIPPGGGIAISDDGEAAAVDFPTSLISTDTLGKVADSFARSVNAGSEFPLKWVVMAAIIGAAIFGGIFFMNTINRQPAAPPAIEQPADNGNNTKLEQVK